jgi:16S rRNA (uracil1498-N3)-methyltransferase
LTIPRIFVSGPMEAGFCCDLREEDRKYIKSVLRLKKNDHLIVFDGQGHEYQALIQEMKSDRIRVNILKKHFVQDKPIRITLAQALPKAGKMDFVVQKATELGVDRIMPFQCARSVPRLTGDQKHQKESRWQKIALEASRQCGRADVPEVSPCGYFSDVIRAGASSGFRAIFWEEETQQGIREALNKNQADNASEFFIIIGPEGGFLKGEVDQARDAGFQSISLGRQILRVETAVLAILAIIQYEKGILCGSPDYGV